MKISWKVTPTGGVPKVLKILADNSKDLSDPLNSIKNLLLSSVQENFDDEGRPKKWKDLADSTKAARQKKNKWPGPILNVEGDLSSSINAQVDGNSILVGSGLPYARIHDLGGMAGKGKKVKIPQREFLVFQDEDRKEAREILLEHLLGGSK